VKNGSWFNKKAILTAGLFFLLQDHEKNDYPAIRSMTETYRQIETIIEDLKGQRSDSMPAQGIALGNCAQKKTKSPERAAQYMFLHSTMSPLQGS
jgi:hypothetical protein